MERDPSIRKIDDAHALKALAHPLRLDLLEAVSIHGPLTATAASELVGESPANCSWHLRQLAKYGFIEEVPDAHGRQRPWRRTGTGMEWDQSPEDPETQEASRALTTVYLNREMARIQEAMQRTQPAGWEERVIATESLSWLTADEMSQLGDEIGALLERFRGRVRDPGLRPAGSRPVRMLALAAPDDRLQPTHPTGDHDA